MKEWQKEILKRVEDNELRYPFVNKKEDMKHISKKILEGNKLLLDFMGVKPKMLGPDQYSWNDGVFFSTHQTTPEKVMEHVSEYAKYSTDWNWLMEVVLKIETIEEAEFNFVGCKGTIEITDTETGKTVVSISAGNFYNKKELWFDACVSFVEWYNKEKGL